MQFFTLEAASRRRGKCPEWGTATRALLERILDFDAAMQFRIINFCKPMLCQFSL